MELTEIIYQDAVPIDGYGPDFFRVAGELIEGGLLLMGNRARTWNGFDDVESLVIAASSADFVIVGTGADMRPVPSEFRRKLEAAELGVEPMPSAQACRTYNVLVAEGRRAILAALPVSS